jgi:hypothetical protein
MVEIKTGRCGGLFFLSKINDFSVCDKASHLFRLVIYEVVIE